MARKAWDFTGIDKYAAKLRKLSDPKGYRTRIKQAIYEGAAVIADDVRLRLEGHNSDGGANELLESMYLAKMADDKGYIYTELGFAGYDSRGVPNILKIRAMESGTSKQRKTPIIRPAFRAKETAAIKAMSKMIDKLDKDIMEG